MHHDQGRSHRVGQPSPPTDRVVAVIELLASEPTGCSVAEVTDRLGLSRSTVTSVLAALERSGWVGRGIDRGYTLGPGLIGVAEAVRTALSLSAAVSQCLTDLADRTGCGVALSVVRDAHLIFLEVIGGNSVPAGIAAGTRLPLRAPIGAAVLAHADPARQRQWLASAPDADRPGLRRLLDRLRVTDIAVFRMRETDPQILEVLADVAELLAEHPTRTALREHAFGLIAGLSGDAYTDAELDTTASLPVSYLTAPIRDRHGTVAYELQLGPMRLATTPDDRHRYMHGLLDTARQLSTSGYLGQDDRR